VHVLIEKMHAEDIQRLITPLAAPLVSVAEAAESSILSDDKVPSDSLVDDSDQQSEASVDANGAPTKKATNVARKSTTSTK
jgi:hypothetical protein